VIERASGVSSQHPVQVRIGAQDVRQRQRIDVSAFLARHRGTLPIPAHGQRVDRIHRPAGRAQHRHQQAGVDRPRTRSTVIIAFILPL
jgi:hypothetical protein